MTNEIINSVYCTIAKYSDPQTKIPFNKDNRDINTSIKDGHVNVTINIDPTFKDNDFTFKTISVTSSRTPFIEENSCRTPSICNAVIAEPCIEESKILLSELPMVKAYPFSNGSAVTVVIDLSLLLSIFSFPGLIRDFQF